MIGVMVVAAGGTPTPPLFFGVISGINELQTGFPVESSFQRFYGYKIDSMGVSCFGVVWAAFGFGL